MLNGILNQSGTRLNEESLPNFGETEAIVNSSPLTTYNHTSPNKSEPLTPNHLLTSKSCVLLSPPGGFQQADVYLVKHWRQVQYLVNQFWFRWHKEFLSSLQARQKWTRPHRACELATWCYSRMGTFHEIIGVWLALKKHTRQRWTCAQGRDCH